MGKVFKKVGKIIGKIEKLDPLAGSINKFLGTDSSWSFGEGLADNFLGTDLTGNKAAAARDAAEANARQEALIASLAQQNANVNVDLGMENTPTVDVGGTADALSQTATKRRKNAAGGVSSVLGINV